MDAMTKFRQCVENDIAILKKMFEEKSNLFEKQKEQACLQTKARFYSPRSDDTRLTLDTIYRKEKECRSNLFRYLTNYANFVRLVENYKHVLFRDFYTLCLYFSSTSLNTTDKLQVLITLIESNIKLGVLTEKNVESIPVYQFMTVSQRDAIAFFAQNEEEQNELQKQVESNIKSENCEIIPCSTSVDLSLLQATHDVIQKCYLNKLDTYTIEDINQTIDAFYKLGIPEQLCEAIRTKLKKRLEKIEEQTSAVKKENRQAKHSNRLTNREYKELLKTIKNCYNEYTGEFLTEMTENQTHCLASLMIRLGYDRKTINQFYQDAKRNIGKQNTDRQSKSSEKEFIRLYPKIDFYSENHLELKKLTEEAITYLYETFGCTEEDYHFWYQAFQNVVFQLKMSLPDTFDYEYAQAMALVEQENEKRKMYRN